MDKFMTRVCYGFFTVAVAALLFVAIAAWPITLAASAVVAGFWIIGVIVDDLVERFW